MNKPANYSVETTPVFSDLSDLSMRDVALLNAYEQNAFALEVAYLKSLSADRLLKAFCDIGGVESDAVQYGGWETSAIQGHTLGHYLTAVAQAYATCGDDELKAISDHIIDVLARCQAESGYLAAIPESHFAQLEQGNTAGTWVPWYNMHKLMAGLLEAYELTGNQLALEVASRLGHWVYSRTSAWTEEIQRTVLRVEYGGINDALYKLYSHTKAPEHLSAAHSFDELPLFEALYNGQDVLNGKHANTTIPKINGALNRYITLGESEKYYLQVAENFWDIVVNHHTYVTGGNSEWEHFGHPDILAAERTNCNCETCNTYNMLKMTRELFKITGKSKYADYYESTFINAILSSQNPHTGMTTYFQPMATGFFKVYSSPDQHFWCCTGSGMENFSKLGDSIYYQDENSLYVIRYTASQVNWAAKGLTITQETDLPMTSRVRFTVTAKTPAQADVVLRIPVWCAGAPTLQVNGEGQTIQAENGFVRISREWHDGDCIDLDLPMCVTVHPLPDDQRTVAFKYGPVVLSANLGNKNMVTSTTGVIVTIPTSNESISDVITVSEGTVEEWLSQLNDHLCRREGTLEFTLQDTDRELVFTPHYQQHENRYGIYFRLTDAESKLQEDDGEAYEIIDSLPVANDQYEFSHNMKCENNATGLLHGLNFRHAEAGGFFSYELAVKHGITNYLVVRYFSGHAGRRFTIMANRWVLANVEIEKRENEEFYEVYYPVNANIINNSDSLTFTFKADQGDIAGAIFERLSTVREK